jgi:hypothetical protein
MIPKLIILRRPKLCRKSCRGVRKNCSFPLPVGNIFETSPYGLTHGRSFKQLHNSPVAELIAKNKNNKTTRRYYKKALLILSHVVVRVASQCQVRTCTHERYVSRKSYLKMLFIHSSQNRC